MRRVKYFGIRGFLLGRNQVSSRSECCHVWCERCRVIQRASVSSAKPEAIDTCGGLERHVFIRSKWNIPIRGGVGRVFASRRSQKSGDLEGDGLVAVETSATSTANRRASWRSGCRHRRLTDHYGYWGHTYQQTAFFVAPSLPALRKTECFSSTRKILLKFRRMATTNQVRLDVCRLIQNDTQEYKREPAERIGELRIVAAWEILDWYTRPKSWRCLELSARCTETFNTFLIKKTMNTIEKSYRARLGSTTGQYWELKFNDTLRRVR